MSFSDIKGHSEQIKRLQRALEQKHLAGAYLFTGPEGLGKGLVAKVFAKAINCLEDGLDPCDKCSSCIKIEKLQHPDVQLIDSEGSEIKIESIRQIERSMSLRPYEGKMKVFIVNNAHKLNADSSNAFLKTLEEPSKNSLIILVTSKPQLLFNTITSRCQVIRFYPLKKIELKEALEKEYNLDKNLAHFLAYFAEGSLGEALRLKEQDILNQKNRIIDKAIATSNSSLVNLEAKDREELRFSLNILTSWFRDIYLAKTGAAENDLINLDRKNELLRVTPGYSFNRLDSILRTITDSFTYTDKNVNVKLILSNLSINLRN